MSRYLGPLLFPFATALALATCLQADEPIRQRCDHLKQTATEGHDDAEKQQQPSRFRTVLADYEAFLESCPTDPDHYDLSYYHAEAQWALAHHLYASRETREEALSVFASAHDSFVAVLDRDREGKWALDSAYAQLLAVKNSLEWDELPPDEDGCVGEACQDMRLAFIPYGEDDASMVAALERYLEVAVPAGAKEVAEARQSLAKLRMRHNDFAPARPLANR